MSGFEQIEWGSDACQFDKTPVFAQQGKIIILKCL
jgi:hypothetical protein